MTGFEDIDEMMVLMKENKKEYKEAWGYDDRLKEIQYYEEREYSHHCRTEEWKIRKANKIAELKSEMNEVFNGYFDALDKETQRLKSEANCRLATAGGREYVQHGKALTDKNTPMGARVTIKNRMDELSAQWVAIE